MVRQAGYDSAVTTQWGATMLGVSLLTLRRFDPQRENNQDRAGGLSPAVFTWQLRKWKEK